MGGVHFEVSREATFFVLSRLFPLVLYFEGRGRYAYEEQQQEEPLLKRYEADIIIPLMRTPPFCEKW